jgi:hypothetical protein
MRNLKKTENLKEGDEISKEERKKRRKGEKITSTSLSVKNCKN